MDKEQYTDLQKIRPFTRSASYGVDVDWSYIEKHLLSMDEPGGMLDLDPDFQRAHVWTEEKQIAYIEYVLRGGTSSKIIQFNCSSWHQGPATKVELVDGKQRLEAVRRFMRSEIPAFGTLLKNYTGRLRLHHCRLHFAVNDLKTRAEVLQWYLDLNAGGVVHTSEELDKVRRLLSDEFSKQPPTGEENE